MLLMIDKPKGISSHDVVDEVRSITGIRKVGHGGTLDPNATGLLIVGVGRESTKKLGNIAKDTNKTYKAEIVLGEERDTDDVEGKIRKSKFAIRKNNDNGEISQTQLRKILDQFRGKQKQIPPLYSAIKIKGNKAYDMARKGKSLILKSRDVEVFSLVLISFKYPILKLVTEVSSGTYIRSLARDLGRKLGCGAYLLNLRRTKIGTYDIKDAVKLSELKRNID